MPVNYKGQYSSSKSYQKVLMKRLRLSIFGIIGFIVLVFISVEFFAPQIGGLFGFISANRNEQAPQAKLNLGAPTLNEIPEFTNKKELYVEGVSNPGINVKLYLNGPEIGQVLTGGDGKFVFDRVPLIDGRNTLFAKAIDSDGNNSEKSQTFVITLDTKGPKIEIQEPKSGSTVKNLNNRIPITGKVSEKAKIRINDKLAIQKPDLSFEFLLGASEGTVKIKVTATDEAGNESKEEFEVKYLKQQP